ncbi:MAG: glycoside hydrolase family 25 protein, partial [Oscillospiraceae bacterium]|nr:glycoside hydrolase family 25 protein [Oscillospiraceae bacterium]
MKQFKKMLSLLLVLSMVLTWVCVVPVAVNAAASDYIATSYAAHLSVKTTNAVGLRTYPNGSATAKYTVPTDTMLTVTALHKGTDGGYWYEVLFYNETLYVDGTATTLVDHLVGDVKATDLVSPGSLDSGASFSVSGTISSSINELGTVTAAMYWGNNLTLSPEMSASGTASNNTYSLAGSTIDSNLVFGNLDTGVYTYTISAEAISYYIDDSDALAESVKTVLVERQRCIITDYTNPNDITGWGVDVSVWNGTIDWSIAKDSLDFAILRCSWEETADTRYAEYAAGCEENGIPFGVYVYSYAESVDEAVGEAEYALSLVKGYDMMQLPIFFDAEDAVIRDLGAAKIREVTQAFLDVIKEAGYTPGIYTTSYWFNNYYTTSYFDSVAKWVAQIDGYYGGYTSSYDGGLHYWQYNWEGSCPGIYSNSLDVNYTYDLLPGMTNDTSYRTQCTAYSSNLLVKTNASVTMKKYPCNSSVSSSSTDIKTVSANTTLHVTALYKNTAGEYWYQVDNGTSSGYIPASSATVTKFLYDDLAVLKPEMASNLSVGSGYYLKGSLTSQYNSMSTVYAKVYTGEDTTATPVLSSKDTCGADQYRLNNSDVCDGMIFSDLSTGYYTYEISADVKNYYVSGSSLTSKTENVVVWTAPFTVGSASVTPPPELSCTHNVVSTGGVAATCTTDGLTPGSSCSKCGIVLSVPQVIPATGHSYKVVSTTPATCEDYEIYNLKCANCNHSYSVDAGELSATWVDAIPSGMDTGLFKSKTQYRYSDYQTTTSYAASLAGYTLKSSEWEQSGTGSVDYVNSWPSGFSTSNSLYSQYNKKSAKVTASETATAKTEINSDEVTGYLYYHWCYSNSYYSVASSSGSYTTFHAYYSQEDPDSFTCDTSDYSYKTSHSSCSNSNWWFVTEVYTQSYTNYKMRYTYERWTDYSDWSDTAVTASNTRKVETRTVYQLKEAPALGRHTWVNGKCNACGISCSHTWSSGRCSTCAIFCSHTWSSGRCSTCGSTCSHSWSNGKCSTCGISCSHSWSNGKCSTCGISCSHSWNNGVCTTCGMGCAHIWVNGTCSTCGLVCGHNYVDGICSVCGGREPAKDYYLFGYIN